MHTAAGGPALALVDEHGDLSGTFGAAGSAMTSSTTYDPWGSVLATTGPAPEVGYQGQWTDPATGQTDMGARFYSPASGGFQNSDTSPVADGSAVSGNGYAYADDNPMSVADPTGHSPSGGSAGGNVTKADVTAAAARANEAAQIASQAESAAANAEAVAAHAASAAAAAHRLAQELNNDATSAEAKLLGDLAETALAKGPLGALFENGVLTGEIEETNAFGAEAWHGWENLAEFSQRMESHELQPVVMHPPIGYTGLYGLNPQADPIACAMLVIGCGTSLVGRLIQVMRGKG